MNTCRCAPPSPHLATCTRPTCGSERRATRLGDADPPPRTRRRAGTPRGAGPCAVVRRTRSEVLLDLGPLALDVVEATAHEERLLGNVVVVTVGDLGERLDGVDQRHRRALDAGELLGDVGVLRQEALD